VRPPRKAHRLSLSIPESHVPRGAGTSKRYNGQSHWQDAIYIAAESDRSRPGLLPFSISYELEYFQQLTSEKVRTKFKNGHPVRYWFKPDGVRNEPHDRRVHAMAALRSRSVPMGNPRTIGTLRTAAGATGPEPHIRQRQRPHPPAWLAAAKCASESDSALRIVMTLRHWIASFAGVVRGSGCRYMVGDKNYGLLNISGMQPH
jgi:hypothetical protein